jgi:hypothetical protein
MTNSKRSKGLAFTRLLPNVQAFILWVISLAALVVFQSSQDVSISKIGYFALFLAAATISFFLPIHGVLSPSRLLLEKGQRYSLFALLYTVALLLFFGFDIDQIRDAIPYILLTLAPFIGRQIGQKLSTRYLAHSAVALSVIASFLTFSDWISRRGGTDLVSKVGLSTAILPALGFALGIWISFYSKGMERLVLIVASTLILAMMLGTGNRTNLTLLAALLPLLIAAKLFSIKQSRVGIHLPKRRAFSGLFALLMLTVAIAGFFAYLGLSAFLEQRLLTLSVDFFSNSNSDQSFLIRSLYYEIGIKYFQENPFFGSGFNPFINIISIDNPFEGLVKIGILGSFLYSLTIYFFVKSSFSLSNAHIAIKQAYLGWTFVLVALLPFGTIWQDKGFAVAMVFVAAITQASLSNN